jgi:hypothetical protein
MRSTTNVKSIWTTSTTDNGSDTEPLTERWGVLFLPVIKLAKLPFYQNAGRVGLTQLTLGLNRLHSLV